MREPGYFTNDMSLQKRVIFLQQNIAPTFTKYVKAKYWFASGYGYEVIKNQIHSTTSFEAFIIQSFYKIDQDVFSYSLVQNKGAMVIVPSFITK